ncbi:MAG: PHB depolymerase family esterase, partial [Gemmatimonadaceae bacterium]
AAVSGRLPQPAIVALLSVSVGYNTRKAVAKPAGELKARIDSLDAEIAAASRAGKTNEMRRLYTKGTTLLAGRVWSDSMELSTSLLLRTDRVVIDPKQPYTLRIEQQYKSSAALSPTATAHVFVRSGAQPTGGKEIAQFKNLGTDLQSSPYIMKLDLRDVPTGRYSIAVEIADSTNVVGTTSLPVVIRSGIDETVSRLEADAKTAPASLRAEILYPVDRMRNVNRGLLELRTLDTEKDFAAADSIAVAVKQKKDPFANKTGDIKRHYTLDAANEIMPYRVYVPSSYKAGTSFPLIIALHGLGATEDSFFDSYGRELPKLAEHNGYIMATSLGYRVDGGYGWGIGAPPSDSVARRSSELSELDVMQVLAQVQKQYNVDPKRIYLMGHSLGAIGTWKVAAKYPDIWAALGVFSGQGSVTSAEVLKKIPEFVVHGDTDPTVNVRGSRTMVAALKAVNTELVYIEVPGGNHTSVVAPNLAGMIEFFNAHKKP